MERLTVRCGNGEAEPIGDALSYQMIDKLCAYEDAEEAGLLVRLPCKVGDTYYCIIRQCGSARVEETKLRYQYIETAIRGLGKWAFPTREEAEAALAADGKRREATP